jgi:perosamine synthetase
VIKLFNTNTTLLDSIKAKEIVQLGLLSEGDVVKNFENKLASRLNLKNVFTTNSGTSALHLALLLAGVGYGDEVILPAQTFVATGLAILYCGAKPVFVDIRLDGNIDPQKIEEKITEKTKAIIGVDWGGFPCDRNNIREICDRNNLYFIVDAAHSLGAIYGTQYVGDANEDFTCFSFQAIKLLTTGDGGAVVCAHREHYERGKKLRWFGIDRENDMPDETGERLYNLTEIGYKYHMNNISAAVGLNQIKTLSQNLTRRRTIATVYNQELADFSDIRLMSYHNAHSSYWLYPMLVDGRNNFIEHLYDHGIEASVVHQGIDRNDIFGGLDDSLEIQRRFDTYQVNIPVHNNLTDKEVLYIVDVIKRGWW